MNETPDKPSHFIRDIIDADLAAGRHAAIKTRFPPEPNGYLHIGHAKSICLNFGLALDYPGTCNLRYDDTNPVKEDQEYVDSIADDVRWLGFAWEGEARYASDYFEQMYDYAAELIRKDLAYVCTLTPEEFKETIDLNLTSAFLLLKYAVKPMFATGGAFVFFSTVATGIGLANHEAIASAKAGIDGLVISGAASYASKGIRVNAVAPGLTETPLASRITSNEAALKASIAMHPLGRIGTASDIASAAAWLVDPRNNWITGQILRVDGGLSTDRQRHQQQAPDCQTMHARTPVTTTAAADGPKRVYPPQIR
jgi:hypothetical protein